VLLVVLLSYFAAYLLSVLASVVLLWLHNRMDAPLIAAVTIFAVAVLAIPSAVLWVKTTVHRLPAASLDWMPGAAALRQCAQA
jgi:glycosyltransferase 2 family protein